MSDADDTSLILKQMLAKRSRLANEVADAQARLDKMDASIAHWAEANNLPIPRPDLPKHVRVPSGPISDEFRGLTLPAAVKHVLEMVPGRQPKTASEILAVLQRHHAAPTSSDPVNSVKTALLRRKKTNNDVLHTTHGRWGVRDWYSENEIAEFEKAQDGANARDRQLHHERMKAGIDRVKAAGAHYGARPRITPLQWKRALELVDAGVTSIAELHREMVKLTPRGEKPMVSETVRRIKDQLFANEPYPENWRQFYKAHPPAPPAQDSSADDDKLRLVGE